MNPSIDPTEAAKRLARQERDHTDCIANLPESLREAQLIRATQRIANALELLTTTIGQRP